MGTVVAIPGNIMESIIMRKMSLPPRKRSFSKPYAAMEANSRLVKIFTAVSPIVLKK